ncbi:MAG: MCE family protein [Bacteroidetes bacterium]|nr:MCE family protein [Bacteroidota bacterium]
MFKDLSRNVKLGVFVFTGTLFFIVLLYFIGSKRNLFSSTLKISAKFYNADGLMSGNSVRFAGINIGTVESVEIINDSTVLVQMVIQNKATQHIKKNSIASIGTDGLMGNKLVNISSVNKTAGSIEDGDELTTLKAVSASDMMRTLSITNENILAITEDLKEISSKLNKSNSLWSFLSDTTITDDLRQTIVSIRLTGERTAYVAGDLTKLMAGVKEGKGTLGALLVDTSLSNNLHQSIVSIKMVSKDLAIVSGDLSHITKGIKNGEGAVGTLLMDTTFVHNMNKSMENINTGSKGLSDNMEALKHSIFLRKYFKKQEKEKLKKK